MLRSIAAHKTYYPETQMHVVPRADASKQQASRPSSEHPLIQRRPSLVFQEAFDDKSVKEESDEEDRVIDVKIGTKGESCNDDYYSHYLHLCLFQYKLVQINPC